MKKIWLMHLFFIALTVIGAIGAPILKFENIILNFLSVLGFLGLSFTHSFIFGFSHEKKEKPRNILKSEYEKEFSKEFQNAFIDAILRAVGTSICFTVAFVSSGFLFTETSVYRMFNFFYNQTERQVFIYFVFAWIIVMMTGWVYGHIEYDKKVTKT